MDISLAVEKVLYEKVPYLTIKERKKERKTKIYEYKRKKERKKESGIDR